MALFMGTFAMPQDWKAALPEVTGTKGIKDFIIKQALHLGLDLQGGTQLDYALDLRQAEKYNTDDKKDNDVNIPQLVEGVRTTLERRVNGLGVSEPNIYRAEIGNEQHIIVELAGISDINKAKEIVGKTIQLEFKEQKTEADPLEKEKIKNDAAATLAQAKTEANFSILGEKIKTGDGKITYQTFSQFKDEINKDIQEMAWNAKTGDVLGLFETNDGYTINDQQQLVEMKGYAIVKVGKKEVVDREKTVDGEDFMTVAKSINSSFEDKDVALDYFPEKMRKDIEGLNTNEISEIIDLDNKFLVVKLIEKKEQQEEIRASHILLQYQGSERSTATRTKLEAKKQAEEVLKKVSVSGANFADIAKQFSDGPSTSAGGDLGFFKKGAMHPKFEEAAFALKTGEISKIVETPFGFHIIKKTEEKPAGVTKYTVQKISVAKTEAGASEKINALRERVNSKKVKNKEEKLSYERIFYSALPDPWKSTGLDGSKFVRSTPTFDQFGRPLVAIQFNTEGADLFAQLTERNIGKPIAIFVGGVLISAPNVNEKISGGSAQITGNYTIPEAAKLSQDLNTGAISAPIVLVGQHQIGATLGKEALDKSILAGMIGIAILAMYLVLQYRILGLIADLALGVYAIILLFILKTSAVIGMPITLTLAGIAGIILSIGMAVDANILIFERIKEELRDGKKITAAISIGFERAWLSIRDSNVSSLITCAILAWFGSSIIRGFAINLAIGILVSMFTAITVTRSFLYFFYVRANKGK